MKAGQTRVLDFHLLADLGISLDAQMEAQLKTFHQLLLEHNERMDLTNVPETDMTIRHYADSLLVLKHHLIPQNTKLIDVGTGAGFPGLPLAIARRDVQVALLESKQKRCAFLHTVITALGLTNATVLCARAEDLAVPPHRNHYDVAMARAVAPLNELAEYLLPYVRIGGQALCWKGPAVKNELDSGRIASMELGGRLEQLVSLEIPGRSHYIQVIRKLRPTPKKYPRKAGMPAKFPLGIQIL
jgi:16S rRNA (guanine527-N7)-methyltransferase